MPCLDSNKCNVINYELCHVHFWTNLEHVHLYSLPPLLYPPTPSPLPSPASTPLLPTPSYLHPHSTPVVKGRFPVNFFPKWQSSDNSEEGHNTMRRMSLRQCGSICCHCVTYNSQLQPHNNNSTWILDC